MKIFLAIIVTVVLTTCGVSAIETSAWRHDNESAHYWVVSDRLKVLGLNPFHVEWPSVEISRECREYYCFRYSGVDPAGKYVAGIARTYTDTNLLFGP